MDEQDGKIDSDICSLELDTIMRVLDIPETRTFLHRVDPYGSGKGTYWTNGDKVIHITVFTPDKGLRLAIKEGHWDDLSQKPGATFTTQYLFKTLYPFNTDDFGVYFEGISFDGSNLQVGITKEGGVLTSTEPQS